MASAGTARSPHSSDRGVQTPSDPSRPRSFLRRVLGLFRGFLSSPGAEPQLFAEHATVREHMRVVERRDWWLWSCAVLITLLLTLGIVSFLLPNLLHSHFSSFTSAAASNTMLGLVGLVLLFDIYTVYQHLQIQQVRKQLLEHEELFRLITENAADMIAVVGTNGERLYNSPSYEK